jgi:hypothetical protein
MPAPDDGEHPTDVKRDREAKYYKRRSAEAVLLLVKREIQTAAARSLAVDPDGKEDDFLALARESWREAVGEVVCNSNEDHRSLHKAT